MKRRKPKSDDQEKTEKALQLILDLIIRNQHEIEPALWMSAMMCALADNCEKSEMPYSLFKEEIDRMMDHYKY